MRLENGPKIEAAGSWCTFLLQQSAETIPPKEQRDFARISLLLLG